MNLYCIPTRLETQPWGDCPNFRPDSKTDNWGDPSKVLPEGLLVLQALRNMAQCPIRINAAVAITGHSAKSRHYVDLPGEENEGRVFADAFDIAFLPAARPDLFGHTGNPSMAWTPMQQFLILTRLPVGAIGFYPFWNTPGWHIDFRPLAHNKMRTIWTQDAHGEYLYGMREFQAALLNHSGLGTKQS